MMNRFVFVTAAALFIFQNANPAFAGEDKTASRPATGEMSSPVITVRGLCEENARTSDSNQDACVTVITREQFEYVIKALNPGNQPLRPNSRKQLAKTYAESLAVEAAARKAGLEDSPEFRAFMRWTVARTVTDYYRNSLQEKYRNPAAEEIDGYYRQHLPDYERVKLARVLVPRTSSSAADAKEFEQKALAQAKSARETLRNGTDPAEVQKEVYRALGLSAPPATNLGERHRADLLKDEAEDVFALKPGEVTQIEVEPENYVIYKVTSHDAQPKEQLTAEISRAILQQKFKETMKSIIDAAAAVLDEEYLDPAKAKTEKKQESTLKR